MAKSKKEKKIFVTAALPENDFKKLKELKVKTGYSIADLIRAGIRNICENQKGE